MAQYRLIGTPFPFGERETYHLGKYLKKGKQSGRIVAYGRFDLDLDALTAPVQLDCKSCHLAHQESCCEGGFPFPPETSLLPVLNKHSERIASRYLTAEAAAQIAQDGLYAVYPETEGHPTVALFGEHCAFCHIEGSGPACMAHRYALEIGVYPEDIKPLSCLLYPLDLIEEAETGRIFVTALTERTASFSRWGEDYYHDFLCANRRAREAAATGADLRDNIRRQLPDDVFALSGYRPAYVEGKRTLVALYGEELWQTIDDSIQKTRQGKGS